MSNKNYVSEISRDQDSIRLSGYRDNDRNYYQGNGQQIGN